MTLELSRPLTLTWIENGEPVGVSAPLDVWVGQIVLNLAVTERVAVMDAVVSEVERLNALQEEEVEPGAEQFDIVGDLVPEEELNESPA